MKEILHIDPTKVMLPDRNGNPPLQVATRKKHGERIYSIIVKGASEFEVSKFITTNFFHVST
jgi:hypothetical protein